MTRNRKALTIDQLRQLANERGKQHPDEDGVCTDLRFTPVPYADGVTNVLGANWTVMVLNCTPGCVDYWRRILEAIAKDYDVAF